MAEVVVHGLRIAYRRQGRGAPLVLFHGAFEDARIWSDELGRLSRHVDVIAWDAPGCGASDDVPPDWDDADWAAAASGFLSALGLEAPTVAGFSLGSILALLLARHHPASVGRLVLVGAYAGWGGSLDAEALAARIASVEFTLAHPVEEWAEAFLDSVYGQDADPGRRATARALLADWRPATTRNLLRQLTRDLRPELAHIRTPSVIVRGAGDARSPRSASVELSESLPNARFVEVAGGHDCSGPELDDLLVRVARGDALPA